MVDKRVYRECVRVLVTKDKQVLLATKKAKNTNIVYFEFPGGGIEKNETLEEAAIKECLEEVGVQINNIRYLNVEQTYLTNYLSHEKSKLYKGGHDTYVTAEFIKEDKSKFNIENDGMRYTWEDIDVAISKFRNGPDSMFTPTAIEALEKLESMQLNKNKMSLEDW